MNLRVFREQIRGYPFYFFSAAMSACNKINFLHHEESFNNAEHNSWRKQEKKLPFIKKK